MENLDAERVMKSYLRKMEAAPDSAKRKFPYNCVVLYDFLSVLLKFATPFGM